MKSSRISLLLAAATLVAASSVHATNGTWTLNNAGNASGTWSTGANWSGSTIADGTDGVADFSTLDITATSTITLDTARSIGTLKFGDTTASNNWNLFSTAGPIILTLATSAGTPTINVTNGTATIGTQATGTNVILAGTQGFTKTGTGRLVLGDGNTNTYGGTTFISQGTLQVGASSTNGRVGSASTIIDISSGATFNHVQGATVSQLIQGAGNVVSGVAGLAATSNFTGLNTYTGSTTIDTNTLNANALANSLVNSAIGASDGTVATNLVITNGGTLAYNGTTVASTDRRFQIGATTAGGTGTISNNAAGATNTLTFSNTAAVTYGTTNQTRTVGLGGTNTGANVFAALIGDNGTGAVSLTKTGTGTWTITGANNYTGATTVTAGTLIQTGTSTNASMTVSSGATFNQTAGTTTATGALILSATGAFTAGTAGNNAAYNLSGGTASFASASLNGTTTVSGGTLNISGQFNVGDTAVNRNGVVNQTGGTVNLNTAAGTGIRFGHWNSGALLNAYNLSGGTLNALNTAFNAGYDGNGTMAVSGTGVANLRTLALSADGNLQNGAPNFTFNLGSAASGKNGGTLNVGTGGITLSTATGVISTIQLGDGTVGAFANWTSSAKMTLTDATTGTTFKTLDSVDNTTARTIGLSGILSGAGKLVKTGAGTLTLSGVNTYTGNTTVSAGTVTLTSTGALLMKIANSGVSNSIVVASGATLNLNGTLNLDITGLTDTSGSWTLITGSGTKDYTNFLLKFNGGSAFTNAGGVWTNGNWSFDQTSGVLTAVPEPSTYGLIGAGALAAVAVVRRRRKSIAHAE